MHKHKIRSCACTSASGKPFEHSLVLAIYGTISLRIVYHSMETVSIFLQIYRFVKRICGFLKKDLAIWMASLFIFHTKTYNDRNNVIQFIRYKSFFSCRNEKKASMAFLIHPPKMKHKFACILTRLIQDRKIYNCRLDRVYTQ